MEWCTWGDKEYFHLAIYQCILVLKSISGYLKRGICILTQKYIKRWSAAPKETRNISMWLYTKEYINFKIYFWLSKTGYLYPRPNIYLERSDAPEETRNISMWLYTKEYINFKIYFWLSKTGYLYPYPYINLEMECCPWGDKEYFHMAIYQWIYYF